MKKVIAFDNSDNEDTDKLTINKKYANQYDQWRLKEDINRLKTKYGNVNETNESSSEEEEIELTEEFEKNFLHTLKCLKTNDPKIYDKNVEFFNENDVKTRIVKKDEKPFRKKDYERHILLEKNGKFYSDDEENDNESNKPRLLPKSTIEKDTELINEIRREVASDDDDDFYIKKKINKSDNEDNQCSNFLNNDKDLAPLKQYWENPSLSQSEKFLRDFILNKNVLNDDSDNDVVTETQYGNAIKEIEEDEQLEKDQNEFERKYNFRFEEPDQEFIKRYPRTIETSVRKKSDKRRQKRQELKERKMKEKIRRIQEMKRFESLKKKEIEQKVKLIQSISGNYNINLDIDDLDEDFDPEKYDKKMSEAFDDNYYENDDEKKPDFPDVDQQLDLPKFDEDGFEVINSEVNEVPHCEDPNFNMDCDYVPDAETKPKALSRKQLKKLRKNQSVLPNGEDKTSNNLQINNSKNKNVDNKLEIVKEPVNDLKKSIHDLKNIGCEDFIGDMPCRFKYKSVLPNDYGLTTEEILMADDKELDKWFSFKRMNKIRPDHVEKQEFAMYRKKVRNDKLKRKLLPSLFKEEEKSVAGKDDADKQSETVAVNDKRLSQKRRNSNDNDEQVAKKLKSDNKSYKQLGLQLSDTRLQAFGLNPNKFWKKLKYKSKNGK